MFSVDSFLLAFDYYDRKLEEFEKEWIEGFEKHVKRVDNISSLEDDDLVCLWVGDVETFRSTVEHGFRFNIKAKYAKQYIHRKPTKFDNSVIYFDDYCFIEYKSSEIHKENINIIILNLMPNNVFSYKEWILLKGETDHHSCLWFIQ